MGTGCKVIFSFLLTVLSSSITLINLTTFILFDPFCFEEKKKTEFMPEFDRIYNKVNVIIKRTIINFLISKI